MGQTGCLGPSLKKYPSTLRKTPEEREDVNYIAAEARYLAQTLLLSPHTS